MTSVKRESYSRLLSPHFPAICVKIQFLAIFHRLCLLVGNPLMPPPLFLTKICHWVLLQCYGVVNKKVLHKSEKCAKTWRWPSRELKTWSTRDKSLRSPKQDIGCLTQKGWMNSYKQLKMWNGIHESQNEHSFHFRSLTLVICANFLGAYLCHFSSILFP